MDEISLINDTYIVYNSITSMWERSNEIYRVDIGGMKHRFSGYADSTSHRATHTYDLSTDRWVK